LIVYVQTLYEYKIELLRMVRQNMTSYLFV